MAVKKKVLILPPTFGIEGIVGKYGYEPIFYEEGVKPDIVFFMGGTDINPKLYGEAPISETQYPDNKRDLREIAIYHKFRDVPRAGICRGAQLLNVLNGGRLYQHVNNHAYGKHDITDQWGSKIVVSSYHHQMIIPANNMEVIGWSSRRSTLRKTQDYVEVDTMETEPEVLWEPVEKQLLVQGHPEFGPQAFEEYFFNLIDKLIWENT